MGRVWAPCWAATGLATLLCRWQHRWRRDWVHWRPWRPPLQQQQQQQRQQLAAAAAGTGQGERWFASGASGCILGGAVEVPTAVALGPLRSEAPGGLSGRWGVGVRRHGRLKLEPGPEQRRHHSGRVY